MSTTQRKILASAGVQVSSRALTLLVGILWARTLGAEGYGVYSYALAVMAFLALPAEAGVPNLLMREVAAAEERNDGGLLKGAILRGTQFVAFAAVVTTMLGFAGLSIFTEWGRTDRVFTFVVMLFLIPIAAMLKTLNYALMGLDRVVKAQTLELFVRPATVLAILTVLLILRPAVITPPIAMTIQVAAVLFSLALAVVLIKRHTPAFARNATPVFRSRRWLRSILPFTLIGGALAINAHTDVVMLGWFAEAYEVGIYRVAVQVSTLIGFGLSIVSSVVTPQFSRLYVAKSVVRLQEHVTKFTRITILITLPLVFILILQGEVLLRRLFGAEFASAYPVLLILCASQCGTALFGLGGPLLSMTGFEAHLSKMIWVAASVNAVLNLVLIPYLGAVGAALATATTQFGWSGYQFWFTKARLGVLVLPIKIGAPSPPKER